jgi:hypothetical protein
VKPKGQSRMDNPEKLPTLGTQDSRRRQQNKTQHTMCWTPPRTRRKTKRNKNTKKNTKKTKQNQKTNKICIGHHYSQDSTNNVNKT